MKIEIKNKTLFIDGKLISRFFTENCDMHEGLQVTHAQIVAGRLQVNGTLWIAIAKATDGQKFTFSKVQNCNNVTQIHRGSGDNVGGDNVGNGQANQTHYGSGDNVGGSKFINKRLFYHFLN